LFFRREKYHIDKNSKWRQFSKSFRLQVAMDSLQHEFYNEMYRIDAFSDH